MVLTKHCVSVFASGSYINTFISIAENTATHSLFVCAVTLLKSSNNMYYIYLIVRFMVYIHNSLVNILYSDLDFTH